MKTKSTSQLVRPSLGEGGFFNLRVLISLFVFLSGVFLALLSLGPATTGFAQGTTREQMTLVLAQALSINPPACVAGQEMFNDVPASSPFCAFIEELSRRGITGGCAPGLFCPGDPVTRQQMAVFLVRLSGETAHDVGTTGEPPFQNGWTNFGTSWSQAGFFKDGLGFVHLKGTISSGTLDTTAFTLPEGYRPDKNLFAPCAGTNCTSVFVFPDGQVQPRCPVACDVGLEGLTFRAAP
jgi:hypothetical protein